MAKQGLFIALEGTDGAGKATQVKLLGSHLRSIGHRAETIAFPHYESPTGKIVKQYLNNEFGPAVSLDPRTASKFYADDRLASKPDIEAWLAQGITVVSDRYDVANKAHQGSKIDDPEERKRFYAWLDELEYGQNRIPKPDLVIILHVPAAIGLARAAKRTAATGIALDGHENIDHLLKTERTYLEIAQIYAANHVVVSCVKDGEILDIDAVSELIWEEVKKLLLR